MNLYPRSDDDIYYLVHDYLETTDFKDEQDKRDCMEITRKYWEEYRKERDDRLRRDVIAFGLKYTLFSEEEYNKIYGN